MKNLSVYIHIPFCVSKCGYCDFLSFSNKKEYFYDYVNTVMYEMKESASEFLEYSVDTIFFGGGTPTVLTPQDISDILEILGNCYNIGENAEISVESNPETIGLDGLKELYRIGVNRISFGVQSFDDDILKRIGRIHSRETAIKSFYAAHEAGFKNINLDLMFALPGQSISTLENTLDTAIEMSPEHISVYGLILEEGSKFFKEKNFKEVDDSIDRQMYALVKKKLKDAGYTHYEISNFAKEGFNCKHNIVYWTCGDYKGFGLGAHSLVNGIRFHNTYDFDEYLKRRFKKEDIELLKEKDKISEFIFLGLRMIAGINCEVFFNKFAQDIFSIYKKEIEELINEGFLIFEKNNIRLSDKGIDLSNYVFTKFI